MSSPKVKRKRQKGPPKDFPLFPKLPREMQAEVAERLEPLERTFLAYTSREMLELLKVAILSSLLFSFLFFSPRSLAKERARRLKEGRRERRMRDSDRRGTVAIVSLLEERPLLLPSPPVLPFLTPLLPGPTDSNLLAPLPRWSPWSGRSLPPPPRQLPPACIYPPLSLLPKRLYQPRRPPQEARLLGPLGRVEVPAVEGVGRDGQPLRARRGRC